MSLSWEDVSGRDDPEQRHRIYRLCVCSVCDGARFVDGVKCPECRGEGMARELLATCPDEAAAGVTIATLGREGAFEDCPMGWLDTRGEKGKKWVVRMWQASPRNVSDAGRVLGTARKGAMPPE